MNVFRLACLAILMAFSLSTIAQKADPPVFKGAQATKKMYKAIYQLNSDDDKKIKVTLKNIQNALDDPRLKGKVQIELIVHGGGVALYMKDGPYQAELMALLNRGVILAQCENTLRERKIDKEELWPFVSFAPSANGELIIRQAEGWAYIHP
ncbi:intracellular sulfur oxidation DsrE/DsrF family protein [Dyadobacter sp. BE34]|uniref:Intracellular sulfur oxidation DsrE/DsrF family protein n=1 Tax=Dyadobacter fermentans TaxID=94254 RepID=A0ABU1R888_9BACT|nr:MULTISPECIES: DsrE family protein [Dyadobacter]MDR6809621.1 intracellular sulfur oxidation DsrE/DsrF family protein [Dyadobacter fermentans]MDR7047299.1 intracellular sulfur oxidation DsrE/DsrF family protein [Dyadobacter sp. BE242]MDR7201535.1 intracellular sulfur oxidation DsrE/DsrF family protein [Dyadobacter sp. BE34]MDR7219405.1 intracellular sulfur oxidation DsrE/DsrF family protein [Dyadobacter sp. BE31]MDR7267201.1 intracellular sulfur oxidation DsrE/DsrF family protein [Dyadobacter